MNTVVVFWYKFDGYDRADAILETTFTVSKNITKEEVASKLNEKGYNPIEYDFFIISDKQGSGELK